MPFRAVISPPGATFPFDWSGQGRMARSASFLPESNSFNAESNQFFAESNWFNAESNRRPTQVREVIVVSNPLMRAASQFIPALNRLLCALNRFNARHGEPTTVVRSLLLGANLFDVTLNRYDGDTYSYSPMRIESTPTIGGGSC